MELNHIDAGAFREAFLAAANALDAKKEWINELNVFPVPDGDTGTNMTMTIMSAAKEVAKNPNPDMGTLCSMISQGTLRGARGNSGVILSQLLRGFTKEMKAHDSADTMVLAAAMGRAVDSAYKAVMKPKEGTILTVAKAMGEKAAQIAADITDIEEFGRIVIEAGDEALANTPNLLPVLKQAGVVDSGGQGLMVVLKGAYNFLMGVEEEIEITERIGESSAAAASNDIDTAEITFGYCTEFIINASLNQEQVADLRAYLDSIGDSVVCVEDENIVKIHVHTDEPGNALQKGLSYGQLSRMKIDNLREEHNELFEKEMAKAAEKKEPEMPRKETGFISVSAGEGIKGIFESLGVDVVISGGQTMNPSTEDILDAIGRINADVIYVLPNNKNIIMAAQQAAVLTEDKDIRVIPTRNIPQGITAMIAFVPDDDADTNVENMKEAIGTVKCCEVTYAVRDTHIDGFDIHKDDIMAIGDKGMLAVDPDITEAVLAALSAMADEDSEIASIYYGDSVTEEEAQAIADAAAEKFGDMEIELREGGQPVYYYLISVE